MFYRYNKFGRRGFRPGAQIRFGLIFLFGGWIIIPVLGGLFGAGIITVGALMAVFGELLSELFSGVFSAGSIVVGLILGLVWYFHNKKNAEEETKEENTFESRMETPAEEPIIETRHYSFH